MMEIKESAHTFWELPLKMPSRHVRIERSISHPKISNQFYKVISEILDFSTRGYSLYHIPLTDTRYYKN